MSVNDIWKITIILYVTAQTAQTAQAASLRCYKSSSTNYVEVSLEQSSELVNTYIKLDQEVIIVIHGYQSNPDELFIVNIIESLIETFGDNKSYCALNWKVEASGYIGGIAEEVKKYIGIQGSGKIYFPLSFRAGNVGENLGKALLELKLSGVQMKNIYLMGYSEGAHLAGEAGRIVRSSGKLIGRITGLDPAKPTTQKALDKNCAKFVDVIYTDRRGYGINNAIGHIDFWVNYGCSVQPGCEKFTLPFTLNSVCSHVRAPLIMAEAVKNPFIFLGRKADSYHNFMKSHGSPDVEDINRIGFKVIPNNTGSFYLCTNAKPVYGKGRKGMDPANCAC